MSTMATMQMFDRGRQAAGWLGLCLLPVLFAADITSASDASTSDDPLLDLFIQKGFVSQEEAAKVKAEADYRRTNSAAYYQPMPSKWKLSDGIKSVELFGDVRVRYEDRSATAPANGNIDQQRFRYAVRFGLRGDAFDDFYYGLRLETAANPRSPWVTMGSSTSGSIPYQGPFGKSMSGLNIGQAYIGWRPESWVDVTVGRMPNLLYSTPMVWDTDINLEGTVERFKFTVGQADLFATFGQFIYQNPTPTSADAGLLSLGSFEQNANNIIQLAWQGGFNYHVTTNVSFKAAATVYQYFGFQRSTDSQAIPPYFGDPYVGEGAYTGPGSLNSVNGASGYSSTLTQNGQIGYESYGYPNNQVGLNHLLVLEAPFELNFKVGKWDARLFGDVAYNLEGSQRAKDAAAGYAFYLQQFQASTPATIAAFAPQTKDVMAYQVGFAIGSRDSLGLVYGTVSKRHAWEFRTYWQHIEQYALDPNLIDSDFFEGRENMEGIYTALAYSFTDNFVGTVRYGHANRINDKLGTGGSNQDTPWMNPINSYDLFQADLTFRF